MNRSSTTPRGASRTPPRTPDLTPTLRDAFRMLLHWKWTIGALVLGAAVAAALLVLYVVPPTYRASVTLLIEDSKSKIVAIDEVNEGPNKNREYFQTQAELIRSLTVAQRVVRSLNLAQDPSFAPAVAAARGDASQVETRVIEALLGRLSVDPVRLSQLVKVSYDGRDPRLAATIVDAIARTYIAVDTEERAEATRQANTAIAARMRELKTTLDQSERELMSYRESERIVESRRPERGGADGAALYGEVSRQLLAARIKRQELEQAYRQLASGDRRRLESAPAIARNPGVMRAREIEATARRKLEEIRPHFGASHPTYVAAAADLRAAQEELSRQIDAAIETARKDYESALAFERGIEGDRSTSRGTVLDTDRKMIRLAQLEGEVETNRQLYERFLSRMKETSATRDMVSAPARIVEAAAVPHRPVAPNKPLAVIGAALGMLLACVIVVTARARHDDSARTADHLAEVLDEPVIAVTPLVRDPDTPMARFVTRRTGTLYAESVRSAATALTLMSLDTRGTGQVVVITSSCAEEGKSTLASNLALHESNQRRTLLVEGDMRRPSLASSLGLPKDAKGLSDFLAGKAKFSEVVHRVPGSSLSVVPCGRLPSNPVGRLSPERLGRAIEALRKHYALIVIDSPPVRLVPDALLFGSQADGVVYCVRSGATSLKAAAEGLDKIRQAGVPVLGLVLSHHDFDRARVLYGERSSASDYAAYRTGSESLTAPTRLFTERLAGA